jgi:hypothetical protein
MSTIVRVGLFFVGLFFVGLFVIFFDLFFQKVDIVDGPVMTQQRFGGAVALADELDDFFVDWNND